MTFNTGNPIGSTDARDRSDNSENLDLAVNSLSQTFVDRLGRTRDTLEGIYQKSAYYRVGTFDAGYTLTNNRQTLAYGNIEYSWSGAFPKVVAAGATPATSGGIGAGAWVDKTDLMLRSEISSPYGAKTTLSNVATAYRIDISKGADWYAGVTTTSLDQWFFYQNEVWSPLQVGNVTGDTPSFTDFRKLDQHSTELHYELFGAVTGTDCTAAIQRCHDYAALRYWPVHPRSGSWKISDNITISKDCDIFGYGKRAVIESVNPLVTYYLQIKGGGHTEWKHTIRSLQFITVGIDYGVENTDFANGAVIDDCWIREPDTAVNYGHNSWCTTISNTVIQNSLHGVFFDFAKAMTNAGAHMVISNSQILGCSYGVYINGTTADGFNVMISNADIEHCIYSIFTNNAGDGTIFWNGGHCELNTSGIARMNGGSLWLSNVWALSYGSDTYQALFDLSAGQSIPSVYVSDMRLQYVSEKLVKLADNSSFFISKNSILYGGDLLTNIAATMATSDSSGGSIKVLDGSEIVSTESGISVGPFTPKMQVYKHQKFLSSITTIDFNFNVTAGTSVNTMRFYLNHTSAAYLDIPMDNVSGSGNVTIKYIPYGAFSVRCYFNNKSYTDYLLDPHAANVEKSIDIYSLGGESGSTYSLSGLTVRVG